MRRALASATLLCAIALHAVPAAPPRPASLRAGVLLIAHPGLPDPNFARTVVLVLRHGPGGAMGLVLNRPAEVEFQAVFPELPAPPQDRGSVHVGGPVAQDGVQVLVGSGPAESRIVDGVHVARSAQEIGRVLADPSHPPVRAYAGHAGWAPGQLEAEIARGDWFLLPAHSRDVFLSRADTGTLWRQLLDRATLPWV